MSTSSIISTPRGLGIVVGVNSTTSVLTNGAVFTGTAFDATEYATITVSVFADQASATDGLSIQQSVNGTNWDQSDVYTIPASTGKTFSASVDSQFIRIVYTNGGVTQTTFRLQTLLHKNNKKGSSVRPQDARSNENDMEETLGYMMGYNGTTWDRLRGTTANGLAVDVTRVGTGTNRVGTMQLTGGATSQALGLGATVTAYGNLRVTEEPNSLFNDPFDGTVIDITNRWNAQTVTGFTVTQGSGNLIVTTNTTASNFAYIDTQPTFASLGISFLAFGCTVKLEAQTTNLFALNQHRFIGFGDRPASYATATPLKNAYGFEIDTDGILYCGIYQNGTRVYRTAAALAGGTLNSLVTPSTGFVRLGMAMRADTIIWYVNSTEYPAASFSVATSTFSLPDVQALPIRIAAINAPSGTVGASTFVVSTVGIGDTGNNSGSISDGTYPWRKVSVGTSGGMAVRGASITGTSASIAAAGTGTIGPVLVTEAGNVTFTVKNTIAASAYAGAPVLVFEQSDDNASWGPLIVVRSDTGTAGSTFTLAPNSASASLMFDGSMEGVSYVRCRVTTGPTTNALTVVISPGGLAFTPVVSAIQQPLTKATQGTTGVTTQDLKDAGRSSKLIAYDSYAVAATAETLINTGTVSTDLTSAALSGTGTYYQVNTGKRFRVQSIIVGLHTITGNTTAAGVIVRIRGAVSGAPTTASALLFIVGLTGQATATGATTSVTIPVPDGFELIAANTIGVTVACSGFVTTTAAPKIDVAISGYEY